MKMIKPILTLCVFALIANILKCTGSVLWPVNQYGEPDVTPEQSQALRKAGITPSILWAAVVNAAKRAILLQDVEMTAELKSAIKKSLRVDLERGAVKKDTFLKLNAVLLALLNDGVGLTEVLEDVQALDLSKDQINALREFGAGSRLRSTLTLWKEKHLVLTEDGPQVLEGEDHENDLKVFKEALKKEVVDELMKELMKKLKEAGN